MGESRKRERSSAAFAGIVATRAAARGVRTRAVISVPRQRSVSAVPVRSDLDRDGGAGHGAGEEALVELPRARHRKGAAVMVDREPVRAFRVPHRRGPLELTRDAPGARREPGMDQRRDRIEALMRDVAAPYASPTTRQ